MAEECTATYPTPHSCWDHLHPANSLSSWTRSTTNSTTSWHHHLHHHHHHLQNPNSNCAPNCDQDDVLSISTSLTNASNHSGLTVESSGSGRQLGNQPVVPPPTSNDLIGEHASDSHIWSHVLSSVGSNGDLRNGPDVGENLFEALSSKSTSSAGIFDPACDYLKKIDGNWEFTNSSVFNNFFKNLNGYDDTSNDHDHQSAIESERFTKLSNLVSDWSIAPPDPQVDPQLINPKSCDHISLTSNSVESYSQQQPPAFCGSMATIKNPVFISCYGNGNHHNEVKMETQSLDMEAPTSYFRRAFKGTNTNGYHHHNSLINNSVSILEADNFFGMSHNSPCTSTITYSRLTKPLVDIHASKPSFRPLNLSDCKKQGLQATNSLQTRNSNGRTQGITNDGKKKRGEETIDSTTVLKKPKNDSSTAPSIKMHAPKVKLGDRITALQQIVSPFGKTDTASVLLEAIGYINFLHEQVQLLSNPYMKHNSHKDPWGSLDRKDQKGHIKVDLRSRGLCLVPISCTPKVYHESTGSDYWTPTYRGCLYR
ncbi:transcription factor bHLH111-like isoform X2 [Durio zibethinus]|uniref:Transcription factor bHLH111-like isoform X2 n=1 Tax=Durio zibethinus TaxID=66656 RepID=A0A6P6BEZ8_DURZI|nr:transcription factor bHLH111-like isoform X2 [Durio zibethinus]